MERFNSSEYKRSRMAYVIQCTTEYFISILVADVYLAKLLSSIGISDSLVGIISSFITLSFVFQIFSLFLFRGNISAKKLTLVLDTTSIFLFAFMYVVPFLPVDKTTKTVLLIISILLAYICKYLILNIFYKWGNSYVEPTKRARFSSNKEIFSLFLGTIFTAVIGYTVDRFDSTGNSNGSLLFVAAAILILNVCNFTSVMFMKKDSSDGQKRDKMLLSEILKKTLYNKNFRSIIIVTILWDIARYFTVGFMGIFKYKDLMMSVFLVQIINIVASLFRMLASKPIGIYSDKHSYAKGFKLGLILASTGFFINIFTTNSTWVLIIPYTILLTAASAGTNQNSYSMVYSYVDSQYIVYAMAIKNCIGGLFGFAASILGGKILDIVQANNNIFFGVHIYGQQLLSAMSFIITVLCIIYIWKVVEKQDRMIQ